MLEFLTIVVIPVVVVVLVVLLAVWFYNRRIAHVLRGLSPDAWGAACVDPRSQRAWRALTADGEGVHLVKSNGARAKSWSWHQIATVDIGRSRVGVTLRTGVTLHLRDGSDVGLLIPSRSTLRYPRALADQAVAELRERQSGAQH